jgi:hypothetical protein
MMASSSDYLARGKVTAQGSGLVHFAPANTNYSFKLAGSFAGDASRPIDAIVRVQARKLYTVPSGGGFVQPITGEPRIVQGRVVWLSASQLVLKAGTHVLVDLPDLDSAFELGTGEIAIGSIVNVVAKPGATFELAAPVSAA